MNTKIILIALFALTLTTTSCIKALRKGCTFESATNFDKKVGKDDGSCTFEANTSFWFKESTSNTLTGWQNVTELNIYINEKFVGNIDPSDWKVGPDCGGANFTVKNSWTGQETFHITYKITDQSGNQKFNGDKDISPNACENIELN